MFLLFFAVLQQSAKLKYNTFTGFLIPLAEGTKEQVWVKQHLHVCPPTPPFMAEV